VWISQTPSWFRFFTITRMEIENFTTTTKLVGSPGGVRVAAHEWPRRRRASGTAPPQRPHAVPVPSSWTSPSRNRRRRTYALAPIRRQLWLWLWLCGCGCGCGSGRPPPSISHAGARALTRRLLWTVDCIVEYYTYICMGS
jgi:hypothetical protein